MNSQFFEKLEINKVLAKCAEYAALGSAKSLIASCAPSSDLEEVRERLARTEEADKLLFRAGVSGIEFFDDVDELLVRAKKGSALSCGELRQVNALNHSARIAQNSVFSLADEDIVLLKADCSRLYYDQRLEDDVTFAIISDTELNDHASEKLFDIRTKIKSLNARIRTKLTEYITGPTAAFLQDATVTMRNDRFVIPVKAEYKNRVRGFVHDRSQTGATFFIEPEYVLEMNNELIALSIDEREEVERILKSFSSRFGAIADKLKADEEILAELDCCYARAQYAYALKAVKPNVNRRGYINIIKGRHPLIDKNKIVPVSVELGGDYNFLLLSGANTGGKTVTLKMVGLFCLMAACGLYIPAAEGSSVGVFDNVFCDLGDSQSIEESLSTFSSHMKNVIDILKLADKETFVLIDELCAGTDPQEGAILAEVIMKSLAKKEALSVITTHYGELKTLEFIDPYFKNASVEFDTESLSPTYKLIIGIPGLSNAISISANLGLDTDLIWEAKELLITQRDPSSLMVERLQDTQQKLDINLKEAENLNAQADELKQYYEKEISQHKKDKKKTLKIIKDKFENQLDEAKDEIKEILNELRQEKSEKIARRAYSRLAKMEQGFRSELHSLEEQEDYTELDWSLVQISDTVMIKDLNQPVKVLSLPDKNNSLFIQMGMIKTKVKKDRLAVYNPALAKKVILPNIKQETFTLKKYDISNTLDLRGERVEEALDDLENYLDKASLANLSPVYIIHGHGTGALKTAVRDFVSTSPYVAKYRVGEDAEGGDGVCVIDIK